MTRKERVINAINHNQTDIVPYQIDFTEQEYEKVADYLKDPDFIEKIGNHLEGVSYDCYPTEIKDNPGHFMDDYGVIWNRTGADKDIGVIENPILKEPTIGDYKFPVFDKDKYGNQLKELIESKEDTFKFAGIGFSMFERAWSLRGMENLLTDMILEPEFVDELLDRICEYNLEVIDFAMQFDIDGFRFGDDWGQQNGLIMGPKLWRRFIRPRVAKMYERVKSKGLYVLQHSCGDLREIFPDLIEIGLDVYNTFQPEIYDIDAFKREYGNDLTVWGGISTQKLLPFATPEEIKAKTNEIMAVMSRGGGYIVAPTHDVPGDVPAENMVALIELFKNQ